MKQKLKINKYLTSKSHTYVENYKHDLILSFLKWSSFPQLLTWIWMGKGGGEDPGS